MNKVLITLVPLLLVVFLGGFLTAKRYYASTQDKSTETDINHTKTHIIRITDPGGTVHEVTDVDSTTKSTTSTVSAVRNRTNISLLISNDFSRSRITPDYGMAFSREVLGPVTIGLFGLTNKTLGVSVGLNF